MLDPVQPLEHETGLLNQGHIVVFNSITQRAIPIPGAPMYYSLYTCTISGPQNSLMQNNRDCLEVNRQVTSRSLPTSQLGNWSSLARFVLVKDNLGQPKYLYFLLRAEP